jgi:hypothetical protein
LLFDDIFNPFKRVNDYLCSVNISDFYKRRYSKNDFILPKKESDSGCCFLPHEPESLKGKGVTGLQGSGTGDLICQVKLETPVNLNGKQKKLLQQLKNSNYTVNYISPLLKK